MKLITKRNVARRGKTNKRINNLISDLLARQLCAQKTVDWYRRRYEILTASSIASALDANPYLSKLDLLIQKCKPFELSQVIGNEATIHGNKYESVAIDIYQRKYGEYVHQAGLFIHPQYAWLGASPDGIRDNGKLLEIKCVWNRLLTDNVPLYYWIQVQIQMEVCDLDECDLFQCKFVEYNTRAEYLADRLLVGCEKGEMDYEGRKIYWKMERCSLNTIARDKIWFAGILATLESFWQEIVYYRQNGFQKLVEQIHSYSATAIPRSTSAELSSISRGRKRKREVKTPKPKMVLSKICYLREDWTRWIGAGDIRNYILNEPLLDWLVLYYKSEYNRYQCDNDMSDFNGYIANKEIAHCQEILANIRGKFAGDMIDIAHINEKFSIDKFRKTLAEIAKGTPIIHNGLLHDQMNNIYAMPDLLIRRDFVARVFPTVAINCDGEYILVNIKYAKLTIKNGHIVNTGNIVAYKAETLLAGIIGRANNIRFAGIYVMGRDGAVGCVDTDGYDEGLVVKIDEAIGWLRDLRENGRAWDIMRPHRWELYPNMSNMFDYPWRSIKKQVAEKIGEITLLWGCGIAERRRAHQAGIFHWRELTGGAIDFKGKRGEILNNIIAVNRDSENIICHLDAETRKKMTINGNAMEFYVDFETAGATEDENMIYMIGMGWTEKATGEWMFRSYIADRLDYASEEKILRAWVGDMRDMRDMRRRGNSIVYHWSKAEVVVSNKSFKRYNITDTGINWVDLLDIFKDNRIAIRGVFNYGLKNVARGLCELGLITTKWSDNTIDGIGAMMLAIKCDKLLAVGEITQEQKKLSDYMDIELVREYNEVDCKVMWDILRYLREQL